MAIRGIKDGIYSVGSLDRERRLFDGLIPLPDGTTYNSYLVKGSSKSALIDTVDPTKESELLDNLREVAGDGIDYVIANHAEQDHTGALPAVLARYPQARVVTNAKCKAMLSDLLPIDPQRVSVVGDGEGLSLGGRTLEFIMAPWVHWPETMFTYLKEDRILFTCDFMGSHLASDDLYAADESKVSEAAKRYYAEIMMPFRSSIKRHLERIRPLEIEAIAPSHGPIYGRPTLAIGLYEDWAGDAVKNEAAIAYISMHGSTQAAVERLSAALSGAGIAARAFDLAAGDIGELAMAVVDAATVIIAAPAFLAGPHPVALFAAALISSLRPKARFVGTIESYGWAPRAAEILEGALAGIKAERLASVLIKGLPKEADFKALDDLACRAADGHRRIGIL